MKKKFLALVLTLAMVLSLLPATALAAGDQSAAESKQETQADVQVGQKEEPTASVAEEEGAEDKPVVQETPATSYAVKGTTFTSDTGVRYKITGTGEVEVTGCEDSVTQLVIPQTVFYEDVEYTVVSIADQAFDVLQNQSAKNLHLTSVDFSGASVEIGKNAFRYCKDLTEVIGADNITKIPYGAFNSCDKLERISKLSSLTDIDTFAFMYCVSLEELDGLEWQSMTHIGQQAFANDTILKLELTENTFKNLTSIGRGAFSGCSGVTGKVVLPECITEIPESAFSGTGITDVDFSDITSIGKQAFSNCEGITKLNVSDSVTTIGEKAFQGCKNLVSVQIGDPGKGSSKLKSIQKGAFNKDIAITYFYMECNQADVTIAPNKTGFQPYDTIPNSVREIMQYAFAIKDASIYSDKDVTLQQEIQSCLEEKDNITITPSQDFYVGERITIPSGKTVTLSKGDADSISVLTTVNFEGPLFEVEKGASLILDGISFRCHFISNQFVFAHVKGELTLNSGSIARMNGGTVHVIDVDGGKFYMNGGEISLDEARYTSSGAVYVQDGGTFEMNDGEISGCTLNNQLCGAVVLDSGSMTMNGGTIDGNTATEFNSAGGVLVDKASSFTMTGGTISNNSANRGGGVLVRENGKFEMTGGTISENTARVQDSSIDKPNAGGGGVFVEHNASFDMENGTITGNTTNGMGGGVATAVLNENDKTGGGQFHMTGGTISDNKASCGGGVYSWSGKGRVVLEGGNIVDNEASRQGGGVYVSHDPWAITIKNALVTENTATIQGGGIWACPKGTVNLGTDIAIFENSAGESADDAAFLLKWNKTYSTSFTNQQYGGGIVTWYRDTSISHGDPNYGLFAGLRFDASDPGNPVGLVSGDINGYGLKAVVSKESKALAEQAPLKITDNKAQRGGGIGTNGEVTVPGELSGNTSVTVHKVWSGNSGNDPSTVKVNLIRTKNEKSQTIATVILSENSKDKDGNAWSYTFSNLDNTYTYTVTEDEVSGYRTSITKDTKPEVKPDGGEIIPDNDLSFTITNTRKGGGSSGGGGTITIPDDVPTGLDLKNHYGYIIGYPVDYYTGKPTTDQTKKPVRPEGKITRAEVATIYFRMLTDENRAANWNQVSGFSDVKSSAWYNNAISTLTKAGILKGYEDGTFQPNGYITRAEFATIAIRFFSGVYEGEDLFPDIKGHWAEDYINNAANKGLVKGYEDGTFGPDRYITRAEAVTLVNRTLNRHPHNDGLHKDMLVWPDNMDTSKWYYADMQEATNSHEPDKNKSTADKEYWGKMLPIRDWEALEKEWSNANSAPGEGEVV